MIGFGQTSEHREVKEKGIYYIEKGKYQISKMSGLFSMGTSWVPKMKYKAIEDIEKFRKSVKADDYKIVKEHVRPTHSGWNTFGRLDITFVLLDGEKVRLPDSNETDSSLKSDEKDEDNSKENAINELKKLKELLDLDLITQEEYDKKAKELKQIILN